MESKATVQLDMGMLGDGQKVNLSIQPLNNSQYTILCKIKTSEFFVYFLWFHNHYKRGIKISKEK